MNRAVPDDEFESFVDRFARRVSSFDREALADIKHFVNSASRPPDDERSLQMAAFRKAALRPGVQARARQMFARGFQQRSDFELRLGDYIEKIARETRGG